MAATPATHAAPPAASIPATAADHLKLADHYQAEAAAYRKDEAAHAKMAQDYEVRYPPAKVGGRPPWAEQAIQHCQTLVQDLEKAAKDADAFSAYHRMRAAELKGK